MAVDAVTAGAEVLDVDVCGTVGVTTLRGELDEGTRATPVVLTLTPSTFTPVAAAAVPPAVPPAVTPAAPPPPPASPVMVRMISRMERLHRGQLWAFWNQCSMHAAWNT